MIIELFLTFLLFSCLFIYCWLFSCLFTYCWLFSCLFTYCWLFSYLFTFSQIFSCIFIFWSKLNFTFSVDFICSLKYLMTFKIPIIIPELKFLIDYLTPLIISSGSENYCRVPFKLGRGGKLLPQILDTDVVHDFHYQSWRLIYLVKCVISDGFLTQFKGVVMTRWCTSYTHPN